VKGLASLVTLLVAYMAAFFASPAWLEADLLWAAVAAVGAGLLVAVWYAAFAAAYRGVGERGGDE
jgi:uncharacterized MnhB-related membrane protein